jgi:DsbC/DsbD-like thiol-disulfide interchange protein
MDRRIFISTLVSLPFIAPARAALPWSAKFINGGFDGKFHQAGLHIILNKGWKTYWRNPGEAGIPPDISAATADNLESLTIDFPLPLRIKDESGEALAYHDEVLFPLYLKPRDEGKPVSAHMSSFFGVCAQVCTPAKFEGDLKFALTAEPSADADLIAKWQALVPQPASIVSAAQVVDGFLVLELKQQLDDIFVEGPDHYYFRNPDLGREQGKAWIKIDGLKNPGELKGVNLRITVNAGGIGLEQRIAVA